MIPDPRSNQSSSDAPRTHLDLGKVKERLGGTWHAGVIQDVADSLAAKNWPRDFLLRGSLANYAQDRESDIDLVVTVQESGFEAALDDLSKGLSLPTAHQLPPWTDRLVRDFGGIGFVYLLQAADKKWRHVDVYLLPQRRLPQLIEHSQTLTIFTCDGESLDWPHCDIDDVRRRYQQRMASDLEQAVLACYVAILLLRKRLVRRDRLQTFPDTYAAAQCLRDFIVLACYPDRPEYGWHGLEKVADRSSDPKLVLKGLSIFTQQDRIEQPADLSSRVAVLEDLVELLAPNTWHNYRESLRFFGRYLSNNP